VCGRERTHRGRLIDGPSGDLDVDLEFQFARRALLFDPSDVGAFPIRKLIRVRHALVSHAHIDHVADLDRLPRVCLRRP